MVPTLFILAFFACGPSASQQAHERYAEQMQGHLDDNNALQQTFLEMAQGIKERQLDVHAVANRFDADIVNVAAALSAGVSGIQPTQPVLQAVHSELSRAWSIRSKAYTAISLAWADGDLEAYTRAAHENTLVYQAEERYFEAVNGLLGPYGLHLSANR
jgi:hypothetical protein